MKFIVFAVCVFLLGMTSSYLYSQSIKTTNAIPQLITSPIAKPTKPAVQFIPTSASSLSVASISGNVQIMPIDAEQTIPASVSSVLHQGDNLTTSAKAKIMLESPFLSLKVMEKTKVTPTSLLSERSLFTLEEGSVSLASSQSASIRAGIVLTTIASGSATISWDSKNTLFTVSDAVGSVSAAFVGTDNETHVYRLLPYAVLTIDQDIRRARITQSKE